MVTANPPINLTGEPALEGWDNPADIPHGDEALIVSLEGFEGPLDLLLVMARTQKVDLAHVRSVIDTCENQVAGRPEIELLSVKRRLHGDDD